MKRTFFLSLATLTSLGLASTASAEIAVQALVDELTANGYVVRETHTWNNQLRVEAQFGDQRVEMIYDDVTGALISQETSPLRDRDRTQDRLEDGTGDGPDQDRDRDGERHGADDDDDDDHGSDGGRDHGSDDDSSDDDSSDD